MKNTGNCSSKSSYKIGKIGENKAALHLRLKGYKIIERNYSVYHMGEIDIIAKDKDTLCFVEVRLRSGTDYGSPIETVNKRKQEKIIRAAQMYVCRKHIENCPMRFDVVEVYGSKITAKINLIKDAFWAN